MKETPSVSIIIPAYNVADYLLEAIESIKKQTFQDWELIIIDDCSTDNTLRLALDASSECHQIRVIRMKRNTGGAFLPRKEGIKAARGRLIAPLDADDIVDNDYLEKLLLQMESDGSDIIYPTLYRFMGADTTRFVPSDDKYYRQPYSGKELVKETLDGWNIGCGGGLIKKELYLDGYEQLGSEYTRVYADELLTRKLLYAADKVSLSEVRYLYRINLNSVTKNRSIHRFELLINNNALIPFIKEKYGIESREYELIQAQNFHNLYNVCKYYHGFEMSAEDHDYVKSLLQMGYRNIDWSAVSRSVSLKQRLIFKPGLNIAIRLLAIVDAIKG